MKWLLIVLLALPIQVFAQTEDEFLPQVRLLVVDSNELAVQRFCKEVMSAIPGGYKLALVDREDIMFSTYLYDNDLFESVRFEFQFRIAEVEMPDSTVKKNRVVRLQKVTADLPVMTKMYNYIFNTTHTPDDLIAISRHDKAVTYQGKPYNSMLVADDFKAGYWILTFMGL